MRTIISMLLLSSAPAYATDFSGGRLEGRLGYDHVSTNEAIEELDQSTSGVTYGVAAGYDLKVSDRFFAGVEGAVGLSNIRAETDLGLDKARVDVDRDLELSLRLGFQASKSVLLYAKAGYANTRFTGRYYNAVGPNSYEIDSISSNDGGLRLGLGLELAVGGPAYIKAEYQRTGYGDGVNRDQMLGGVGIRI
jgi:outer membrane immunogenic protein